MEKQLKCFLILSLKEMALRRVAVLLWSGSDILDSVSKFEFDIFAYENEEEQEAEWRATIEDKIKDKMLKLDLPESLTKEMIERIRPIGLDIRKWIDSQEDNFYDSFDQKIPPDLTKLCWTSAGSINSRKTAEQLVRCDVLEINRRYCLACSYCLEDDIPLLWDELPEWLKGCHKYEITESHLPRCWPHILKGEFSELDCLLKTSDRNPFTFYQCAFEYSMEKGNKPAAGYFFLKLSNEEREDSLVRTAHSVLTLIKNIDPFEYFEGFELKEKFSRLSFLLSLLNPEQQMEIFASRPIDVLFSFLDWPCQDLFLENAGLFWTLLPPSTYGDLISMMDDRYSKSDFYIPKLYQELFVRSPPGFKKCFVDEEPELNRTFAPSFLDRLFDSEDSETIGVIFRNLDAADRVKLLFHPDVSYQLFDGVKRGSWQVVNVCMREVTLSEEDRRRLKGGFVEYLKRYGTEEIDCGDRNSKRFFKLLDDSDAGPGRVKKRKLEESCAE